MRAAFLLLFCAVEKYCRGGAGRFQLFEEIDKDCSLTIVTD
jgi:hypothetical protein